MGSHMNTRRKPSRGVTIMEVLMALFVMLIGMTGVIALFPVGVQLNQLAADDIVSAMTVQNALAAVRLEPGLRNRVMAYVATSYPNGDVLAWNGTQSQGIDGYTGTLSTPSSSTPRRVGFSTMSPVGSATMFDVKQQGTTSAIKANDCALLLVTSGKAALKLYRLDASNSDPTGTYTNFGNSRFGSVANGYTDFFRDGIVADDTFRLLGARDERGIWATVPAGFYADASGPRTIFNLGQGATEGYGYLAIVTRRRSDPTTVRIDVLVYKGYDRTLPPEGNLPAVAHYTTYWPMEMLDGS